MNPKERQELQELLSALLDGALEAEQQNRLGKLLQQYPEAQDLYFAYFELHAELALSGGQSDFPHLAVPAAGTATSPWDGAEAAQLKVQPVASTSVRGKSQFTFHPFRRNHLIVSGAIGLAGLAAGLLLALTLNSQRPAEAPRSSGEQAEPTANCVAMLVQAPGVEWGETDLPTQPGAALPPGRLRLKSGVAQIQFYSGATIILEGPADLQLISPHEAYCTRGKLRATVPPQAKGFTIGSPKLELVDLGTEFGLRVDENNETEVHVFQGKVKLYDAGSGRAEPSRKELTTGRGFRLDESGAASAIASDPSAFRTSQQLVDLAAEKARRRYQDWLAAGERLSQDPRLVLYYTFQTDRPWNPVLHDGVKGRRGGPWDGAIVGCEWTSGRWPGKQALEFRRPGDRVRLSVPGEYTSLTFMAWVRIDGLDREFSGLFLTDDFHEGNVHWQITRDGQLVLAFKIKNWPTSEINSLYSRPIFGPDNLCQWLHLASVHDAKARKMTHYLNGRPIAAANLRHEPLPIKLGPVEIGNWGLPTRGNKAPIRNLNGRIDEFLLFNQALEAQEIQDLYQAGKPYS